MLFRRGVCSAVGAFECVSLSLSPCSAQAELARIALTSLSSLSLQRSLHRDRANERAVAFNVEVGLSAAKSALSGGDGASPELLAFLVDGLRPASETTRDGSGGATTKPDDGPERDPRAMMRPDVNDGQKSSEVETITKTLPLVAVQPASLQLPQDPAQKDVPNLASHVLHTKHGFTLSQKQRVREVVHILQLSSSFSVLHTLSNCLPKALQLKLFEEVLESQRRLHLGTSLQGASHGPSVHWPSQNCSIRILLERYTHVHVGIMCSG